jgi:hypothetical protein
VLYHNFIEINRFEYEKKLARNNPIIHTIAMLCGCSQKNSLWFQLPCWADILLS